MISRFRGMTEPLCLFYHFSMRFQRSVNTAENAGTQATKHNDYKRPGLRCAAAACFQCSCIELPPLHSDSPRLIPIVTVQTGAAAPFVKRRIDLKNVKCNSQLDEVRRGIVIASPGVCFELFHSHSPIPWPVRGSGKRTRIVIRLSEII